MGNGNRKIATAALAMLLVAAGSSAMLWAGPNSQSMRAPDPAQWMSYGRTWDEQRFSPLDRINDGNVRDLGLAWYAELGTMRGVQGTPLAIDSILYNVAPFNIVSAYDGATGRLLWTFDPKVEAKWARLACCGPSSRGLAAWNDKLYVATLDGRLIAIDRKTGKERWSTQTFDHAEPYSITGAPRVYDGKVVIGNGGADYGVRGFVSAYDAETGKRAWKFYTVPGNPAKGPDGEASDSVMPMAAATWTGEWWKYGGGGTAWDAFAYDPKLKMVYIGTGNGSPTTQKFRSPGGGDNLFLCSILAVDVETGAYRWHYQMVPNEQWDFTCTQPIVLADLKIEGRQRQVLMQVPKNGFFYVLDRATGKVISGKSMVPNTWASGLDPVTGRPIVNPEAYLTTTPKLMTPTWMAAHSWHPMSFSPKTGLVYLPVAEQWTVVAAAETYQHTPFRANTGWSFQSDPELRKKLQAEADSREKGWLSAWNPVTQTEAFRIPYPSPGSGGVLTTAGNLLVQGTINKTLAIYRADNGRKLWEMPVEAVPLSGAITYEVKGEQYIAVNASWGGQPVHALTKMDPPWNVAPGRLLAFKLGGRGVKLPPTPPPTRLPAPPWLTGSEADVARGRELYARTCATCHGPDARGGLKDLRHMTPETHAAFLDIVLKGTRTEKGMVSFADLLSRADAEAIHQYLIARANEDWNNDVHAQ